MEDITATPDQQAPGKSKMSRRRLVSIILIVLGLGALYYIGPVFLVLFVVQPVRVEGTAMSPTLNDGDRIFIGKRLGTLDRGDIVVFYYPEDTSKSFIKRVIGLPGERIDMNQDGDITINDRVIKDYVLPERNERSIQRWSTVRSEWKQIKEGHYFVMGDNRDFSNDSRSWGPVSKDLIYGKYIFRYWISSQ